MGRNPAWGGLKPLSRESVALAGIGTFEPATEPARSLGRGSMREAVWVRLAARAGLQVIVANPLRGGKRLFQIAGFQQALNMSSPDTRQAIGLKLDHHRDAVAVGLAH